MKCDVCEKTIKEKKFKFILVHSATKEDMRPGAFSETDREIICCNDCAINLNFRSVSQ